MYRAKGFAAVDGKPMRLVVQGVGTRFDSYFDRPWAREEARQTELVLIGSHLDREQRDARRCCAPHRAESCTSCATRPGGYAAGDGVVDLGQTPADIVILSAADTDLRLLGGRVRCAGPTTMPIAAAREPARAALQRVRSTCTSTRVLRMRAGRGGGADGRHRATGLTASSSSCERARERALRARAGAGRRRADPELERLSSDVPRRTASASGATCARAVPTTRARCLRLPARVLRARREPGPKRGRCRAWRSITRARRDRAQRAVGAAQPARCARWRRCCFIARTCRPGNLAAFDALIAQLTARGPERRCRSRSRR